MIEIRLLPLVGSFAENKDIARDIRFTKIVPAIEGGEDVVLDFEGIDSATQSFIHALISDVIRKYGSDILDKIFFKGCNRTVQGIIKIVVAYVQEAD